MKRFGVRLGALLLCLCLWAGAAAAAVPSLDDTLSASFDMNQDVDMSMTFELENLPPFDADTVGKLNGVLRHIAVNARLNGEDSLLTFAADGTGLFSINEQQKDGVWQLSTSLLPNRLLTSGSGVLDALFQGEPSEEKAFDLSQAVSEAEECYQALTDLITPYAEEKKANYKIADIGYAKWVRLARLTVEQSETLLPQLVALLSSGMDAAFREQIQSLTC